MHSTASQISTPAGPIPNDAPHWNRQRHSQMPSHRYLDVYSRVDVLLTGRDWPSNRLTTAPLWVPVDLRDGNQALSEPMDPDRKRIFFELMIRMGYKEIEVGYPSASQTDYDFVRHIAASDIAPDDVTIVVFTSARRDLIERTVASIQGITNPVVIHLYTATAPAWRDVVLGKNRAQLWELILSGGRDVLELAGHLPNVRFEFSPEVFNLTEPDYVIDICDAMTELWAATPGATGHPESPCHRRSRDPERVRGSDRVHAQAPRETRLRDPLGTSPQRPRHGDRLRGTRGARRRPASGRLHLRQRRTHRQRRHRCTGPEPARAGHRPDDRLLGHRRDQTHSVTRGFSALYI